MSDLFDGVSNIAGGFAFKRAAAFAARNARKYPKTTAAVTVGWLVCGAPFAVPVLVGGAGALLKEHFSRNEDGSEPEST